MRVECTGALRATHTPGGEGNRTPRSYQSDVWVKLEGSDEAEMQMSRQREQQILET